MKTLGPGLVTALVLVHLHLITSCTNDPDPDSEPEYGPLGGMLEVDAGDMLPGSGGAGGSGGSGGSGGKAGSGGGSSTRGGIGRACNTDQDCKAGLFCHDSADFIGHKQCTSACSSSEACLDVAKDTFCIGAQVCVLSCTSLTQCPPLTRCNDAGWCERGGPGSGVPECAGFPTACSLLTTGQCSGAAGCRLDSHCEGVSQSCYSQYSSYSCTSQQGCFWSTSSRSCSGSARSCGSFGSSLSCISQTGCRYVDDCTGVASSCQTLTLSQCALQPGCHVEYNL